MRAALREAVALLDATSARLERAKAHAALGNRRTHALAHASWPSAAARTAGASAHCSPRGLDQRVERGQQLDPAARTRARPAVARRAALDLVAVDVEVEIDVERSVGHRRGMVPSAVAAMLPR